LVQFENGELGIAFNLEKDAVGIIIMGSYEGIREGMTVRSTGRIASVPVGIGLVGRVVNAIGTPIDGKGPIKFDQFRPIERIAPGVIARQDVDTPLQTGIKAIDSMIPVGRGQRELIIGDRQTGKTAIAIDAIINQKGKDVVCIYVAIGLKKSAVARTVAILEQHGAMDHTIVVVASAEEPAALQYIAPYAGCAMGEEFLEAGRHALIVYDDAWAYRQVSLLLRRPPGREAYPGDLFYLHSRLLERAARVADQFVIVAKDFGGDQAAASDGVDGVIYDGPLSKHDAENALKAKDNADNFKLAKIAGTGGSLTALPIIETLLGDVSAYVPTNVISITDGQIYLENNLFYAGIRPAINVGISVSRVGGDAQTKAIELAAFAQFGSDLDKATQGRLDRGRRLQEILKQAQYQPVSLGEQVIVIYATTQGFADNVAIERMLEWETSLTRTMTTTYSQIGKGITEQGRITDELEVELRAALEAFQAAWR
jgi:F-type H+-transporting ATPase subunit alpha